MPALDSPPPGVTLDRTVGGLDIVLPVPDVGRWMQDLSVVLLLAGTVLMGLTFATIEPRWAASLGHLFEIVLPLGAGCLLVGLLALLVRAQLALARRGQERVSLSPQGIVVARGSGPRVQRPWNEVLAFAPGRGLLCADGDFIALARAQPTLVQEWLRDVIVDAKRRHAQGSAREVPAALRALPQALGVRE